MPKRDKPGHLAIGKEGHIAKGSAGRPPMLAAARCGACGIGFWSGSDDDAWEHFD